MTKEELKEFLIRRGLKTNTVNSSAMDEAIDIIVSQAQGLDYREVGSRLAQVVSNTEVLNTLVQITEKRVDELRDAGFDAEEAIRTLKKLNGQNQYGTVLTYKGVLQATSDVFGEDKMTEAVMIEAIKAGSYAAWREVMGAK